MQYPLGVGQKRHLVAGGLLLFILVLVLALVGLALRSVSPAPAPAAAETTGKATTETEFAPATEGPLADAEPAAKAPQRVSALGIWARLAAVLLVTYGLIRGIKWLRDAREGRGGARREEAETEIGLRLRDAINLGGAREIHLIEAGQQLLVVGSSQGQMILLAQLPLAEEPPVVETWRPAREEKKRAPEMEGAPRDSLREWEWEQRRARLIDALKQQAEE